MNPSAYRGFVIPFDVDQAQVGALEAVAPDAPLLQGALRYLPVTSAHTLTHCGWIYGEILNYQAEDDPDLILQQILLDWDDGKLQADQLNGRFVLLIYNKNSREWAIITDRMGSLHVYAAGESSDQVRVIGSDLATVAMLASDRKLDWYALASLFTFGFFINDSTYYEDVHVLYPASIYHLNAAGQLLRRERYWEWQHHIDEARGYNETLEAYDHLMRRAIKRCARGRTVLPISGGLDSRTLAALYPDDAAVQSYSYGYTPHSVEIRISQQVARAKGLPFTPYVIEPYLFHRLEEIVRALHGCQDVTQARQISIADWVALQGDGILTGLWGDVWLDQMGLADGVPPDSSIIKHTYKKLVKRGHEWLLNNIIAPQLSPDQVEDYLIAQVEQGLAGLAHIEDDDFRVKAYKTSQWAWRWSNASLRGFELGATPRIPYYDVDLVDFFCTVPTEFVRDRRMQIDHLKRYAPAVAKVRWQETRSDLYTESHLKMRRYLALAQDNLRRLMYGEEKYRRNWEVQFFAEDGRGHLESWLLSAPVFEHADPAAVRGLIDALYNDPNAANGYSASLLLTFAGWQAVVA